MDVCNLVGLWVCIKNCGGRGSAKAQGNEPRETQLCVKEELRTHTFLSLYQKVSLGVEEVESKSVWGDIFFWAGFGSLVLLVG